MKEKDYILISNRLRINLALENLRHIIGGKKLIGMKRNILNDIEFMLTEAQNNLFEKMEVKTEGDKNETTNT